MTHSFMQSMLQPQNCLPLFPLNLQVYLPNTVHLHCMHGLQIVALQVGSMYSTYHIYHCLGGTWEPAFTPALSDILSNQPCKREQSQNSYVATPWAMCIPVALANNPKIPPRRICSQQPCNEKFRGYTEKILPSSYQG